MAYQSNQLGRFEIYVHTFPDVAAGRWQVTFTGGAYPRWSDDGRELFFVAGDGLLTALPIQTTTGFTAAGKPTPLFSTREYFLGIARTYDVARDGSRFLMIATNSWTRGDITVISDWLQDTRAKAGTE